MKGAIKKLAINQDYGDTDPLWKLIDEGWSVVSAIYNTKTRHFYIKLSPQPYPEITVPCSSCGIRMLPKDLYFTRHTRLCIMCNRRGDISKGEAAFIDSVWSKKEDEDAKQSNKNDSL